MDISTKKAVARGTLTLSMALIASVAAADTAILATSDQTLVESRALKIVATPEVRKQIEVSTQAFANLPIAADPEAAHTLPSAVEELAFAAALDAVDSDPQRPKAVWGFTAPRTWQGHVVPGSRWGIDNPDNVYRVIPVDGASKYEIRVRSNTPGPIQYSFLVYDSFFGEDGRQAHLDAPVAGLRDRDIQVGADGTFTITVDALPANGRANHIQTNENARVLLVRNTFSNWQEQIPLEVSVKRLGTPTHAALSDAEIARRATSFLKSATETLVGWETSGFAARSAVNVIAKPKARGGGWGFAANGNFKIADDEALVVTLDPLGAQYVGFDLTNPWLVSLEHIRGSGSLNNSQAQANLDGTITYVLAARDPGVYNWLSTGGLHAGNILIRWQALPDTATTADAAVRSVQLVKLAHLQATLPPGTRQVTAAQREHLIEQRALAYAHRYTAVPGGASLASAR
jgi:uncharacterized protein DUF1214